MCTYTYLQAKAKIMSYSINLYLDKQNTKKVFEKQFQIFLYLRFEGRTIKIYVERKCTEKQWDNSKQRVSPRYYKSGPVELNKYLDNVCNEVGKIFEENNNEGKETSKNHLREMIGKLNNRESSAKLSITFEDAYEEFIRNSSLTKQPSTIKQYRNTFNHLNNFSKAREVTLDFKKIDLEFQDCLKEYFIRDLRLTHNTVAKNIKNLKTFLNYSTDREYNKTLIYR
jgi:Phage integrase SAM-like domain/Arm DNA-binding domain